MQVSSFGLSTTRPRGPLGEELRAPPAPPALYQKMSKTGASIQASPRFEWARIGTDWEAEGNTLIASGMLADERYAVGRKVVRSGKYSFTFTINTVFYPDAHMFLGVAEVTDDPEKARTWSFNPPTGNLYIGTKLNEHGSEQLRTHLFEDPKETLLDRMPGAVIQAHVDMGARKLSFSVNGNAPVDSGVQLPEAGVRPWIFLYHEGDSVTVEEVC